MLKTPTLLFGDIEIDHNEVIEFPFGLPGFPQEKKFIFLPIPDTPFTSMQSVTSDVHFFVINPFEFFKEYEYDIPDSVIEALKIERPEHVVTWSIVALKDDITQSTANMQAPVIVNTAMRKGKQLVLHEYQIRQPIFVKTPIALKK